MNSPLKVLTLMMALGLFVGCDSGSGPGVPTAGSGATADTSKAGDADASKSTPKTKNAPKATGAPVSNPSANAQ